MRSGIVAALVAGRRPLLWFGAKRSAACLMSLRCLLLCLLVLGLGCGSKLRRETEHEEVTGLVTYKNKPVTGGNITFVTVEGGFASHGIIDEHGNYSIKAPIGKVQISVDNRSLSRGSAASKQAEAQKGAGNPNMPKATPLKGTFVPLPTKVFSTDTSELTYTVTKGAQTHNIEIKD